MSLSSISSLFIRHLSFQFSDKCPTGEDAGGQEVDLDVKGTPLMKGTGGSCD